MTDVEQLAMEMEFSPEARRRRAEELIRLRRLETACRQHHRRLPYQVQTAMRMAAQATELSPPPDGNPGLFHQQRRTA